MRPSSRSLLDDLPGASILVQATLLVGLAAGPVSVSAAEPQAPTEAAVTLRAVEGVGSGTTREEARAAAQIAARRAILVELIAALPVEVAGLSAEVATELPDDWLGLEVQRESAIEVEGGIEITLHCRYPSAAWEALVLRHGEHQLFEGVRVAAALPDGIRVVDGGGWGALPGDRLTSWNGHAVASLAELREASGGVGGGALRWTVERNGEEVAFARPAPGLDLIRRAPTCGPCCHGHCPDEIPIKLPPEGL